MTTADYRAFLVAASDHASQAKVGLELVATADGHRWHWSNGAQGETTARTLPVAFYHACCDYMDHHNIQRGFNNVVFTNQ